jgi:hypothetical protein
MDFFVYYVFAPVILCVGLIGNSFGFIISSTSKKLKRDLPIKMYQYLFLADTSNIIS